MALVGAACSGDDEAAPTTVPVTVATTVPATVATVATTVPVTVPPVTTQPPPSTSAAPPTVPPTSATAPTTTTPVISSTPATLSPLNATLLPTLETALPPLIVEFTRSLEEAARLPADPARRDAVRQLTGSDLFARIEAALERRVAESRFQRERPGDPPRVEPRLFTAGISADDPIATMEGCFIGTDIEFVVAADGTETVSDDVIDSSLYAYVFQFVDERWLIIDLQLVESFPDTEGCEP
jgi:hypothetical protein